MAELQMLGMSPLGRVNMTACEAVTGMFRMVVELAREMPGLKG